MKPGGGAMAICMNCNPMATRQHHEHCVGVVVFNPMSPELAVPCSCEDPRCAERRAQRERAKTATEPGS